MSVGGAAFPAADREVSLQKGVAFADARSALHSPWQMVLKQNMNMQECGFYITVPKCTRQEKTEHRIDSVCQHKLFVSSFFFFFLFSFFSLVMRNGFILKHYA